MEQEKQPFETLLSRHFGEAISIETIHPLPGGEQGASGAQVRYFEAEYRIGQNERAQQKLVTKNATQFERRVLKRLSEQKQAIPPTEIPDADSEERSPIYQFYADPQLPADGPHGANTKAYAQALAQIHAANRGKRPDWLPQAKENIEKRLYLSA